MINFWIHNGWDKVFRIGSPIGIKCTAKYNGIGSITITLPYDSDKDVLDSVNVNTLVEAVFEKPYSVENNPDDPDNPICEYRKILYVIDSVKYSDKDKTITLNGKTANVLLNRRAFLTQSYLGGAGTVIPFIVTNLTELYDAIHKSTDEILPPRDEHDVPLPADVYEEYKRLLALDVDVPHSAGSDLTAEIEGYALNGIQMQDGIIPILEMMGYGQEVTIDGGTLNFRVYSGVNRQNTTDRITFSDSTNTASNFVVTKDSSVYANSIAAEVALPPAFTKAPGIITRYANESIHSPAPSGLFKDLVMYYKVINMKDTGQGYITPEEQSAAAVAAMYEDLKTRRYRYNISCELSADEFGSAYYFGDTVSIVSYKHGISFDTKISTLEYSFDKGIEKASIVIGNEDVSFREALLYG